MLYLAQEKSAETNLVAFIIITPCMFPKLGILVMVYVVSPTVNNVVDEVLTVSTEELGLKSEVAWTERKKQSVAGQNSNSRGNETTRTIHERECDLDDSDIGQSVELQEDCTHIHACGTGQLWRDRPTPWGRPANQ